MQQGGFGMSFRNKMYRLPVSVWNRLLEMSKEELEEYDEDSEKFFEVNNITLLQFDFCTQIIEDMDREGKLKRFTLEKLPDECDNTYGVLDKELFDVCIEKCKEYTKRYIKRMNDDDKDYLCSMIDVLEVSKNQNECIACPWTWFDELYELLYIKKTTDWEEYVILNIVS